MKEMVSTDSGLETPDSAGNAGKIEHARFTFDVNELNQTGYHPPAAGSPQSVYDKNKESAEPNRC